MKEEKIKQSFTLKAIAYIFLPIFVILIIISGIILGYCTSYPEARYGKEYYDTENFAQLYQNKIYSIYANIDSIMNNKNYDNLYEDQETGELITTSIEDTERDHIYYSSRYKSTGVKYLIINKTTNIYYTNVDKTSKTDTAEEIKQYIAQGVKYWNIENKEINTNIEKISKDNIVQGSTYEEMMNSNLDIYTSYTATSESVYLNDDFSTSSFLYEISSKYYYVALILVVISVIGILITCIYLISSAGHKAGYDEIYLDWMDKLPLEVLGLFIFIAMSTEILLIVGSIALMEYAFDTGILILIISTFIAGITLIYLVLSIIKRIKVNQLLRNTILWRVARFIKRICSKIVHSLIDNTNLSTRITIACIGFLAISFVLIAINGVGIIFLIGFWMYTYIWILGKANETAKIQKALKSIYEGNTNIELNEKELSGVLREMAIYVNDIVGGFSNAVQESIKSERMKTELITNVSHDIKTPLTSIINYVDLLKKEDIQSKKAKEYLDILDSKSQRLKKLIEDLMEASKASSGNIKLEKQLININELIKQVTGEFEDKFKEKNLEIITDYLEEDVKILADNKYIYRIIENLYSNVSKYALENSRVYIDVKKNDNKVNIAIKNISKDRLNISEEELMQRFVRGDSSRNTEGSGLGLSIASSLTKLQGGNFNIYLDGDLFKVVLEFEISV